MGWPSYAAWVLLAAVPKWLKVIVALLLLPACAGAAVATWRVMSLSGGADVTWVPMIAGAACWFFIYLVMPKPMWIYVLGHELTHAVWTWLFGGRVQKIKITSRGGHVIITRDNFLITLAPYFFPFYAVLVVLTFLLGRWLGGWSGLWYRAGFHLLLGAAYAFHLSLTWHILQDRQPDIYSQGNLFSMVIIFLGNTLVLLLGVPLLAGEVPVGTALAWWHDETLELLQWTRESAQGWFSRIRS